MVKTCVDRVHFMVRIYVAVDAEVAAACGYRAEQPGARVTANVDGARLAGAQE